MGILGRLSTLIKSNVNDLIDSMQDPAKEIDQVVLDMEESARDARKEVAGCLAEEKRLVKKLETLEADAQRWQARAEAAVKGGDDTLAREALKRKNDVEAERVETDKALQEARVYSEKLNDGLKALDARVKDVKMRQGSLREKARMAKGGNSLSGKTSAFDDFERMSAKIETVEAEVSLNDELDPGHSAKNAETDRKLKALETSPVDDALAELKKKLGQ